jgi:hypothetical protein
MLSHKVQHLFTHKVQYRVNLCTRYLPIPFWVIDAEERGKESVHAPAMN